MRYLWYSISRSKKKSVCITIENSVRVLDSNKYQIRFREYGYPYELKCVIINPFLEIKSINCSDNFGQISFIMLSLAVLDDFFLNNNQTVSDIFSLYSNGSKDACRTEIDLRINSKSSDPIDISLDKQFLSKIHFQNLKCRDAFYLKIRIKNWKRLNLTINQNLEDIERKFRVGLSLNQTTKSTFCEMFFGTKTGRWPYYVSERCRKQVTLIDYSMFEVSFYLHIIFYWKLRKERFFHNFY